MSILITQSTRDGRHMRHLVPPAPPTSTTSPNEELARGSRHGIYLRALAAAEALM